MTKGFFTSEFYTTLLSYVVSILTLFHVGLPANTPELTQAFAVLASGIATAVYTHSRQTVKAAYIKTLADNGTLFDTGDEEAPGTSPAPTPAPVAVVPGVTVNPAAGMFTTVATTTTTTPNLPADTSSAT